MSSSTTTLDLTLPANLSNVNGQTILITGGASGLGEAMFRRFAAHGANVIIADLNVSRGEALVEEIRQESGNLNHHFLPCNVTDYQSQCALFTRALELSPTKSLHTVIANAGVGEVGDFIQPSTSLECDPPEPDLTTLDVNVKGVIYTSKLALHHFRRNAAASSTDSHLLLVGSMASFSPSPGVVALYTASKHAVLGLFRTLRLHPGNHAKHVRVNLICPYFVDTPIIPTMGRIMLSGVELARSEDVVEAAARLVCERRAKGRALVIAPRGAGGVQEMDVQTMQEVEAFARRVTNALNAQGYVETALRCVGDLCRIFFGGRMAPLLLLGVAGLVAAVLVFSPLASLFSY